MSSSERVGLLLIALGGTIATIVALYGYLAPLTGVTGTIGAFLAIVGSLAVALSPLVLAGLVPGPLRVVVLALLALAIFLTALAGYFLMMIWIPIGCLVAAVGYVILVLSLGTRSVTT